MTIAIGPVHIIFRSLDQRKRRRAEREREREAEKERVGELSLQVTTAVVTAGERRGEKAVAVAVASHHRGMRGSNTATRRCHSTTSSTGHSTTAWRHRGGVPGGGEAAPARSWPRSTETLVRVKVARGQFSGQKSDRRGGPGRAGNGASSAPESVKGRQHLPCNSAGGGGGDLGRP